MHAEEVLVPVCEAGGTVEGHDSACGVRRSEFGGPACPTPHAQCRIPNPECRVGGGSRRVRAILLREGLAKSGRYFTLAALHDVARAAEGLRCFADHPTPEQDRQRPARSVRDLVGYFRNPRVVPGEPAGAAPAQVEATLCVLESAGWLWDLVEASLAPDGPELIGLSIDALCRVRHGPIPAPHEHRAPEQAVQIVESVAVLKSCDVVTRASAGGRFVAVVGSQLPVAGSPATDDQLKEQELMAKPHYHMKEQELMAKPHHHMKEQELMATTQIQMPPCAAMAAEPLARVREVREDGGDQRSDWRAPEAQPAPASPQSVVGNQLSVVGELAPDDQQPATEVSEALARVREAQVRLECAHLLGERLAALPLPEPVRVKLRRAWDPFGPAQQAGGRWESSDAYVRALEAAIEAEVETLAALRDATSGQWPVGWPVERSQQADHRQLATDSRQSGPGGAGLVRGYGAPRVDAGIDAVTRGRAAVQVALDRLFGLRESDDDPEVALLRRAGIVAPHWTSLREAYTQITGDALVTGVVQPELSIVREANEVTTAVLNQALLNSMTKRLIADYAGQPQDWRRFCTVVAIRDFKSQDRVRLFDFGSLSTVAEGAAYVNLAWDDAKESYTPQKRGNTVVVTREAIINDDLGAIRRIPTKLAVAAGVTMNEFVYQLFTSNPFMSDGDKVFDDGVQATHGNRITAPLDAAGLRTGLLTMLKQTNSAGKRLGLRPRFLLVPPDLVFTALTLVQSALVPGSNNNDKNVLQGAVEVISVPQFVDATDWYLVTDPQQVETIEIGFVGGRETPELLLQDRPDTGQVFTNDQITYKIRWEFGGGWV